MTTPWNILKEYIDPEQVIEDLDIGPFSRQGDELIMSCPLPTHDGPDNSPSFGINIHKKVYHCFVCGYGGDLVDLVSRIKQLDRASAKESVSTSVDGLPNSPGAFIERVERLLYFTSEVEDSKNELPVYNPAVVAKWQQATRDNKLCRQFLRARGIDIYTAEALGLGFDENHFRKYRPPYSKEFEQYIGPACIIPVCIGPHLVGWQERWIGDRPEGLPKYTNTPSFPRRHAVYNIDNCRDWAIVVEAPLTTAYLVSNGYSSCALFGAESNPEQIQQLRRLRRVYLSFDNDKAGHAAARKVGKVLDKHMEVFVVSTVPDEKGGLDDLDPSLLGSYIEDARPFFETELEELV